MRLRVLSVTIIAVACRGPAPAAGQGTDDDLRVPAGFHVSVFAQNLQGVRFLALGPGNTVYASQPGSGVIVKLPDSNHDGVADNSVIVAGGLRGPFGIAFRGDTMYVAEERDVKRFDPGGAAPVTIVPNVPSGGHSTRTILFGPDGKLYLAVGSSCNLCDERDSMRAAVTLLNPDGSGGRIFARGLRNTVGMAFNPTTGELWGGNNDRDNLGDDLPPEHVNIIKDGRDYGWPECYLPGKPNPEYGSADCSHVEPPTITIQAHSAPLGLLHRHAVSARIPWRCVRHAARFLEPQRPDGRQSRAGRGRQWRPARRGGGRLHRGVAASGRLALGPPGWSPGIAGWILAGE